MTTIHTKRVYEDAHADDGVRILVDRLWPRGVSKERAAVAFWARDIAPSNELRKWYDHQHDLWDEFCKRYFAELDANPDAVTELKQHLDAKRVTLVFGSKEEKLNNASALRMYLER